MSSNVIKEAQSCLRCRKPLCREGCPVKTPVPQVIDLYLNGKIKEAGKMLFENNPLSLVCSYICPHHQQCEGGCVLGRKSVPVKFSMIEKYISDYYLNVYKPVKSDGSAGKVAVIGSGPAGITIAFILAIRGYEVTLYEGHDRIGGVLMYGIPDFRLPKTVLSRLEKTLTDSGIKIRPNTSIGANLTVDDLLRDGFDAVFIGTGVWRPNKLGIKGETLASVHFAIDYLKNPEVYNLGRRVAVIGAGNTAIDAARTAIRHGAEEVTLVSRKDVNETAAGRTELDEAVYDGVNILYNKKPKEFFCNGVILEDVYGENESLFECDSVIVAIGQGPRSVIVSSTKGINTTGIGLVAVDESGRTSREGIFASGDVVTGAKTVVEAVRISKNVADAVDEYVRNKRSEIK